MNEKVSVRVMLVDDHQIMLDGLRKLLESAGGSRLLAIPTIQERPSQWLAYSSPT